MPAALSLLLGGVFLVSGAAKLRDPAGMVVLLRQVLSPTVPAFALTRALAAAEVLLGVVLLAGVAPRVGAAVAAGALALFTVLLRLAARRAPVALASCRCFGGTGDAPPAQALVRNLALIVAAAVVVTRPPAASWDLGTQDLVGALTVAAGLSCAWLLATALRRLAVVS